MPELPEVETTRRGIEPHLLGRTLGGALVRRGDLRWPVPAELGARLRGQTVTAVERRGKYLLLRTEPGTLIVHLGMSGSLRLCPACEPPGKHDHVDLLLGGAKILRYRDPRRFGAFLWAAGDPLQHALLRHLGPEPLGPAFDGAYLHRRSRGRRAPVKTFIMDGRVVVGVGNIYANEALFASGIAPRRHAGRISRARYEQLATAIRSVLARAISEGGTSLRDFVAGEGRPGYFKQRLSVYGRGGQPCARCGTPLRETRLGQRSTVFCGTCQR